MKIARKVSKRKNARKKGCRKERKGAGKKEKK